MGVITYNGITSTRYGIHVEKPPAYVIAERDYEVVHVPGRNGDIIIDNGGYKNVTQTYDISFGERNGDYTTLASNVAKWLTSDFGYHQLYDSYDPGYYRRAYYSGGLDIENLFGQAGRCTLEFTCKPARYLFTGDTYTQFNTSSTMTNPTNQTARPLIILRFIYSNSSSFVGTLKVRINNTLLVVTATNNASIYIDSENRTVSESSAVSSLAFYDYTEGDSYKTTDFPTLKSGSNNITFIGSVGENYVQITPHWWTL